MAEGGPRHRKFETVQRMQIGSKGSTGKDSTMVPWTQVHINYTGPLNGSYYQINVDSFRKCKHPTATNTTNALNEIFSCFGVPKTLVSDNGTQFSEEHSRNFVHY